MTLMKDSNVVEMAWHSRDEDDPEHDITDKVGMASAMRKGTSCGVHVIVQLGGEARRG